MKSTLIICLPNRKQSHDNLEKRQCTANKKLQILTVEKRHNNVLSTPLNTPKIIFIFLTQTFFLTLLYHQLLP